MNIQAEKIELMKLLLNTNNPKIIQSLKQVFKKSDTSDFWDELSQDEQNEINNALSEIEEGNVVDYDVFMEKYR
jgi:hypothetical protein